ncbi:ribonuclease III [Lactobacillus delbrueckii]|uniref:Ribonuclease 3 n=1 Tax=Lactobacillus delbrueckii TaxID=1584 RepID=A0AAW5YZ28_9LACO|nr:ribonuclease III [Lactobacillus delbrueckii]TXG09498.1 ribonuclease III [Lactobacillus delbrueckii subsp. bulgaricus]APP02908.1 ribonuclease III [Lactobacillus delbrueckii subsp. indicus]KNE30409.1 ribonuclease III [Lactobacillus delbrueckii subsp. indicus]KRL72781.1 ribonuclease iii [Lactobacillus delbrueckii subsp. indicus DSM 15996]MCT2877987.1 ribonuclease III [Lactobacillus delbrueckii]
MVSTKFIKMLDEKYGIRFKDVRLLEEAFTHSSYVNENPGKTLGNYEKLEFLGDAVLEFTVSDYLYRHFQHLNEGELTRLRSNIVRTEGFSKVALDCGFKEEINLGVGEEKAGGRKRKALLEDVFEAFNGALFLDQGIEAVEKFLSQTVYPLIAAGYFTPSRDFKTDLQELLQQNGSVTIEYRVLNESQQPPHFEVEVLVDGKKLASGEGRSKKKAEQDAASHALEHLNGGK